MLKSFLLGWPVMLAVALAMLQGERSTAERTLPEASWDDQVAAVRAGRGWSIVVDQAVVTDRQLAELAGLQGLIDLELGNNDVSPRALERLAALPSLRKVRLGKGVDDDVLRALCQIPTLRYLNLPHTTVTDEGLAALRERPQLVQLRLGSTHVDDRGMKEIARLGKLRFLHLIDAPISDRGLAALAGMTKLESLYIDGARISDAGIERLLEQLPELHFHIDQQHHDRDPLRGSHGH